MALYHLDKRNAAEEIISSALETFDQLGAKPNQKWAESLLEKMQNRQEQL